MTYIINVRVPLRTLSLDADSTRPFRRAYKLCMHQLLFTKTHIHSQQYVAIYLSRRGLRTSKHLLRVKGVKPRPSSLL